MRAPVSDGDRHVLFQGSVDTHWDDNCLCEQDVETGSATELKVFPGGIVNVLYSPDWSRVAVVALSHTERYGKRQEPRQVWVYQRASGRWRLLDQPQALAVLCGWSKAGDRIFYRVSCEGGTSALKQITVSTGARSTLMTGLPGLSDSSISGVSVLVLNDGHSVIVPAGNDSLKQVNVDTGAERILITSPGMHYQDGGFYLSPSERYLAVSTGGGNMEMLDLNSPRGTPNHITIHVGGARFAEWHPSLPRFLVTHYWAFLPQVYLPIPYSVQYREYRLPGS